MDSWRKWKERVRALWSRGTWEDELQNEMHHHLEMEIAERIRQGMEPDEARRIALIEFGGVERYREQTRDARWGRSAERVLEDSRYALRSLWRNPTFAVTSVLTVALGIAAVTTMFSVVDSVVLRPLPYPEAASLVRVEPSWQGTPNGSLSPAEFVDVDTRLDVFSAFGVYSTGSVSITGDGEPTRVSAAFTSWGVFPALGVEPQLGRWFTAEEDEVDAPVAILSDGLWRDRFASETDVVGRTLTWNGLTYEVIGVMPPGFGMPEDLRGPGSTQLFLPAGITASSVLNRGSHYLSSVARRRNGVSLTQASTAVQELASMMVAENPEGYPRDMNFTVGAIPLRDHVIGSTAGLLWILTGAVISVLLIVVANVANLLFARAEGRGPEFAVRSALGAGRARIVSQLLTESLVLAAMGGFVGVLLASFAVSALPGLEGINLPRMEELALNKTALGFALLVTTAAGILFGLLPSFQASAAAQGEHVRQRGAGGSGPRGQRIRRLLIVSEMSFALVLLLGAGLFTRSLVELTRVDTGFQSTSALATAVSLPASRYPSNEERRSFFRALEQALLDEPGISAAGAVSNLPLATSLGDLNFEIEGRPIAEGSVKPRGDWQVVSAGYFDAIGLPLLRGRSIERYDDAESPGVVVVSESLAELHWPGEDPLGKRFLLGGGAGPGWVSIVGVVPDVRHASLSDEPNPQYYLAHDQFTFWNQGQALAAMSLVVEGSLSPDLLAASIRRVVSTLDPIQPVASFTTMREVRGNAVAIPEAIAVLMAVFSLVALLIAGVGIFGVVSHGVGRRTQEFGVRLALGARPTQVAGLILRDSAVMAGLGVVGGLIAAAGLSRFVADRLFRVSPFDPATLIAVSVTLFLTAVLAAYLPARKATRLDPVQSLRPQ